MSVSMPPHIEQIWFFSCWLLPEISKLAPTHTDNTCTHCYTFRMPLVSLSCVCVCVRVCARAERTSRVQTDCIIIATYSCV